MRNGSPRGAIVPSLDQFRELDQKRRGAISQAEQLKARKNEETVEIGKLKREGADTTERQKQVRAIADEIAALDEQVKALDDEFRELLAGHSQYAARVGARRVRAEADNVEVRRCGEPPQFDFEPKAHWDLGPELGILDLERAAKITGARFALYWDMGAKLERALINFMLDVHTREHGYTEVLPPFLVNSQSLFGTGQLPKFKEDLFKCEGHDFWLIPTAEVPVTNIFRDETLDAEALPIRLCAYTPCFRSEAGSYGRDVRGIIRQHQFQKVELVKFTRPEQSYDELEKLTADAEDILRRLGLPFRTVVLSHRATWDSHPPRPTTSKSGCRGRTGTRRSRPARTSRRSRRAAPASVSAAARRRSSLHTLNGSGLAVGRTWVAIVENYQQKDGTRRGARGAAAVSERLK